MESKMIFFTLASLIMLVLQETNAQCPEANGRFPVEDQCDAYIECRDGVPEMKLCPDGLLFNDKLSPDGECQFAPSVLCGNRAKLQPPFATEDCPHQFGFYRIGDVSHCNEYMNCAHGVGKITKCPEGLAFNKETYRCDWPDQTPDCDAEAFLGFTCPIIENPSSTDENNVTIITAEGDDLRYYRHPHDCRLYFVCVNGRPRQYRCGNFLVFNLKTKSCDFHTNVPGCRKRLRNDVTPIPLMTPTQKELFNKFARAMFEQMIQNGTVPRGIKL